MSRGFDDAEPPEAGVPPDGEHRATSVPARTLARARELSLTALDVVPGLRRLALEVARVEVIDRAIVIAAQGLFSVTPLLVVIAAFSPDRVATAMTSKAADVLGVDTNEMSAFQSVATTQHVRTQTTVFGILLVLFSALSFARALQRMLERVWELPHRGGLVGNSRCLYWLLLWIVYLQMLALLSSVLGESRLVTVRFGTQVVITGLAWWWTSRMLLLGRVSWSALLLGAGLTAVGLTVLTRASRLVMPAYVKANVDQFGAALGLLFAISTWLIAFGGVLVAGALIGRVYTEELSLMRRFTAAWGGEPLPNSASAASTGSTSPSTPSRRDPS